MRCPKCHYISFDTSERCRNCGYEFSFSVEADSLDLPIQTGDEALGPLADFSLSDRDSAPAESPRPPLDAPAAPGTIASGTRHQAAGEAGHVRRTATPSDLPLFKDRPFDDDTPLVTAPAVPRTPLAVRRSNPALSRAHRAAHDEPEPELDLEFPEEQHEPIPDRSLVPPPSRAEVRAELDHPAAGIPARLFAGVIDLAILAGIDAAVLYFTLKIVGFSRGELLLLPMIPLVAFLLLLDGGYLVAFVAAGGQTIGKMATGIKVVPAAQEGHWTDRVPLGTAFLRATASLVSLAPAGAGFLPALLGADRRALHDRLAHTRVVRA